MFQMEVAYSAIVWSLENLPDPATFKIDFLKCLLPAPSHDGVMPLSPTAYKCPHGSWSVFRLERCCLRTSYFAFSNRSTHSRYDAAICLTAASRVILCAR